MVGKLALLVAWRRFDVMYSSPWSGMNTHAWWKNGLFVVPAVEMRREWDGEVPMRWLNETSYCMRLIWSGVPEGL